MRPSARLVRAVAAERADLERQRAQLAREADELRAALARIERGLGEIDAQCALLDRLAGEPPLQAAPEPVDLVPDDGALRGPAVRAVAVEVLQASGREALHYRDWYDMVVRAGHRIAGKDPLAVFLTQLGRSPVLRKGAEPGVYELDPQARTRLHQRLERLHDELRHVRRRSAPPRRADQAHHADREGPRRGDGAA